MQAIQPINRRPLHEEAVDRLRDLIVRGDLAPGARLNERLLCGQLGISRTPLREAIKLLATEGLVELLPNRGAIVSQMDPVRLSETLAVMGALVEPGAGSQAPLDNEVPQAVGGLLVQGPARNEDNRSVGFLRRFHFVCRIQNIRILRNS